MAGAGGAYDRGHPSSGNLFAHCAAQLLAVHLVRQYTSSTVGRSGARAACPAPPRLSERQIQQVLAFIHMQLGEQLSLAVLAQPIGYSSYHFARLLRRTLGASPHQVVLRLRLARAQRLLEAPTLPLARSAGERVASPRGAP